MVTKRSSTVRATLLAGLLEPTPAQRDYFGWLIEVMDEDELLELLHLAFDIAAPLERGALLDAAADLTGMKRFHEFADRR